MVLLDLQGMELSSEEALNGMAQSDLSLVECGGESTLSLLLC
jgi:hypothetical protein